MSQRRRIVVDQDTQVPKDVESLDGTDGCPAPLLGRCLRECYYTFRPRRRPKDYHFDPTEFVEPVWTDTHSTDVQAEDDVVIDKLVESRPLRLMSTVFPNTSAPHIGQTRVVELDDIEWFYTKRPGREEFTSATKQPQGNAEPSGPITGRLNERSHDSTYEHRKEFVLANSENTRQVMDNRIVRRTTKLPDDWEAAGSMVKQEVRSPEASAHQYKWFRSILGWTTS
ncbi:uncharacterized protein LOC117337964 [Pecten maximus]|uniref:uncharacterized protein LOC117337964 n=1 Tax=Pecten maximus TaxID=6579 RepID=UPI0014586B0B|nr:uncharacterized protein LOC117337964 [Pecten maximus]XP_033755015.1 uncharacterized protein LOC117337964 [Pecten maximus]